MSGNHRQGGGELALQDVQIGTAQAARGDLDDDLPGSRDGIVDRCHRDLARGGDHCGLHCAGS
jgi:hypothetical protein